MVSTCSGASSARNSICSASSSSSNCCVISGRCSCSISFTSAGCASMRTGYFCLRAGAVSSFLGPNLDFTRSISVGLSASFWPSESLFGVSAAVAGRLRASNNIRAAGRFMAVGRAVGLWSKGADCSTVSWVRAGRYTGGRSAVICTPFYPIPVRLCRLKTS